jgi:hypothetical protein
MSDAVTAKTIFKGNRKAVFQFTNKSDGTGENNVKKIDISTLRLDPRFATAPTTLKIVKVWFAVQPAAFAIQVQYNHTTPDVVLILSGSGSWDFSNEDFGGITDPGSAGGDGSINFNTIGAASAATYSIIMEVALHGPGTV